MWQIHEFRSGFPVMSVIYSYNNNSQTIRLGYGTIKYLPGLDDKVQSYSIYDNVAKVKFNGQLHNRNGTEFRLFIDDN